LIYAGEVFVIILSKKVSETSKSQRSKHSKQQWLYFMCLDDADPVSFVAAFRVAIFAGEFLYDIC